MIFLAACGEEWLNINEDPINPTEAQLDLYLPAIQGAMVWGLNDQINEGTSIYIQHAYGLTLSRYEQTPASFSESWEELFAGSLQDIEAFISASEADSLDIYAGVGKIYKAYIYVNLVDMWGDAPYTEAFQGLEVSEPMFDDGAFIYDEAYALLDEAIEDLANDESGAVPSSDMFYGGRTTANYVDVYTRLANTIKLKMYVQERLVNSGESTSGITSLINDADLIDDADDDFVFNYGTNLEPNNRHPQYSQHYQPGKSFYMNNFFMNYLITRDDPRLRFYIYRQTLSDPTGDNIPCLTVDCNYGYQGDGYIGRDHGDGSGIPPDDDTRATYGVYPAAGLWDPDGGNSTVEQGDGGQGAGILPLITTSMVKFWLAEASYKLGTPGDPRALLEDGIRESIDKVISFGLETDETIDTDEVPDAAAIDAYVQDILDRYDNPEGVDENDNRTEEDLRFAVLMEQAWVSLFGNGYEAYNNYRRTGHPDFEAYGAEAINPLGGFPLRLPMSIAELQGNANADNTPVTEPVFWDQ
ncbi:MAG: SusD/RagB family nutrient-binding outer membrane lipoprotein [Cyclobacteriaceae bacterium]